MKPTIKASISGIAFNLEEDAYRRLKHYLDSLQGYYEKVSGGKEIIDDIELRIAELLGERIGSPGQVVSERVIKEVITILGQPEEISGENTAFDNPPVDHEKNNVRKKLYRDIDHKVLGGVCSGLANYFNIDVVLVRVLFVVFFFGFSIFNLHFFHFTGGSIGLIYILMWIITPPARTVQQRFEMHGETPTVKNIQRKVEEGLRDVGSSVQKTKPVLGEIFRAFGKVCAILIGACLVLIAIGGLTTFIVALVSGHVMFTSFFSGIMDYVAISWHPWWFFILLSLVLFLPLLGILYGGIKLLFHIKTKIKIGLIIFLLWIIALFAMIGVSIFSAKSFFQWRTVHEYVELPAVQSDTIYVDIPQKYYTDGLLESAIARLSNTEISYRENHGKRYRIERRLFGHSVRIWENNGDYYESRNYDEHSFLYFFHENEKASEQLCLLPVLDIDKSSNTDKLSIDIRKGAAGENSRTAYTHARQLPFSYQLNDSLLIFDPLVYTKENKWDGEFIRIRIRVPEGKTVVFGKAFREPYDAEMMDWE